MRSLTRSEAASPLVFGIGVCILLSVMACVGPAVRPSIAKPAVPLVLEPGQGEPGEVTGHVYSAETGEPLGNGCVWVWNTDIGSNVEADGLYAIGSVLAPGRYTLVASAVGFEDGRALLEVKPGSTSVVDFRLNRSEVEVRPENLNPPDRKR